jgi:hypothetical protein
VYFFESLINRVPYASGSGTGSVIQNLWILTITDQPNLDPDPQTENYLTQRSKSTRLVPTPYLEGGVSLLPLLLAGLPAIGGALQVELVVELHKTGSYYSLP